MRDKPLTYTAKTHTGLESVLAGELAALGAGDITPLSRAVSFRGDRRVLYAANLWLRTATRVLLPLREFKAGSPDKLYQQVYGIDWQRYLTPEMTFAVDATVARSTIDNSMFAALKVKDAVVDHLRKNTGTRPSVDTDSPDLRLNLRLADNTAVLSLDSSGGPLSKRGYRTAGGAAPLAESLAAGLILLAEWNGASPLYDPMCGSGTIAIEAALIAANSAPGLMRESFGFQRWLDFDEALYERLVAEAQEKEREIPSGLICAADRDPNQLAKARSNATRAGVVGRINFSQADFFKTPAPSQGGTLVFNPPYGERLPVEQIAALYTRIGDQLKSAYSGWSAYLLTGNLEAAKSIGLRTSARHTLFNGPLECRLLRFDLYRGSLR